MHDLTVVALAAGGVRRGDDGASGGIKTEVRLVHQLFVEGGVYRCVVILDGLGVRTLVDLATVFEQFVQDRLLLVVVNVHPLALDGTALGSKGQKISDFSNFLNRSPTLIETPLTKISVVCAAGLRCCSLLANDAPSHSKSFWRRRAA